MTFGNRSSIRLSERYTTPFLYLRPPLLPGPHAREHTHASTPRVKPYRPTFCKCPTQKSNLLDVSATLPEQPYSPFVTFLDLSHSTNVRVSFLPSSQEGSLNPQHCDHPCNPCDATSAGGAFGIGHMAFGFCTRKLHGNCLQTILPAS